MSIILSDEEGKELALKINSLMISYDYSKKLEYGNPAPYCPFCYAYATSHAKLDINHNQNCLGMKYLRKLYPIK